MEQTKPLTNLQLELLKIFSREVSEADLLEIRKMLARYFAEKAINLADQVWDANKWTEKDEERFLNEYARTTYKPE
jgi:hypothetical protein